MLKIKLWLRKNLSLIKNPYTEDKPKGSSVQRKQNSRA